VSLRVVRKRLKNWLIYVLIKFFVNFLRSVSRAHALSVMRRLGWLGYYVAINERRKTIRHLTWVYGEEKSKAEIATMAKEVFINLGRNATDAIRLPIILRDGVDSIVEAQDLKHMDSALAKGKGVVVLVPHLGNWELLGSWLVLHGYPLNAVGAPVYDRRLNDMVVKARNSVGYKNIARGKATRDILRALRRGEMVAILMDQDTRVGGVFVDFFGRKAHTPVGPIVLAQKTGASIVPIFIHMRRNNSHVIECMEEIVLESSGDPESDTLVNAQKCNDIYEEVIRRYPTQWVWMHERWKKGEAVEKG
jgi:KDO2-lipid IV(A) lauroyltransferase